MVECSTLPVDVMLRRDRDGLKLTVKVIPEVEEFFKKWGGGVETPVTHGRLWRQIPGDKAPLRFWTFERNLRIEQNYDMLSLGAELVLPGTGYTNLSFLRTVGASAEGGRTFAIEQVMSIAEMDTLANRMGKLAEHFYLAYIQPANYRVFVGVLDLGREMRQ